MTPELDLASEFDRRIAAIHAPSGARGKEHAKDVRHEEFKVLTEVYLGTDYDTDKLEQVEALQIKLDKLHLALTRQLDAREITQSEYSRRFKELVREIFGRMQKVLGEADFIRLFGDPLEVGVAAVCPDEESDHKTPPPKRRHGP